NECYGNYFYFNFKTYYLCDFYGIYGLNNSDKTNKINMFEYFIEIPKQNIIKAPVYYDKYDSTISSTWYMYYRSVRYDTYREWYIENEYGFFNFALIVASFISLSTFIFICCYDNCRNL